MCDGFIPIPEKLEGVYQIVNRMFSDAECGKHESCLFCPNNGVCVRELKDSGVVCC